MREIQREGGRERRKGEEREGERGPGGSLAMPFAFVQQCSSLIYFMNSILGLGGSVVQVTP